MAIGSVVSAGRVAPQTVVKDAEDRRLVRTNGRVLDSGSTSFFVEGNPSSKVSLDKGEKVQVVQMPPKDTSKQVSTGSFEAYA